MDLASQDHQKNLEVLVALADQEVQVALAVLEDLVALENLVVPGAQEGLGDRMGLGDLMDQVVQVGKHHLVVLVNQEDLSVLVVQVVPEALEDQVAQVDLVVKLRPEGQDNLEVHRGLEDQVDLVDRMDLVVPEGQMDL